MRGQYAKAIPIETKRICEYCQGTGVAPVNVPENLGKPGDVIEVGGLSFTVTPDATIEIGCPDCNFPEKEEPLQ